jgi:chromosome partitioning protein
LALIIAVLHLKGGSGKTTLAVNLAAAAHLEGLSTLVIDADTQGSAFDWSVARAEGSALEGLAVVKADKPLKGSRFAEIIRGRDVVVIDGPARQRDVTISAAMVADVVCVPICPGPYDFWSVSDTNETLDQADAARETPPLRAYVLNRFNAGQRLSRVAEEELRKTGGVIAGTVRLRVAFGERGALGESVFGVSATKEAAEDIAHVWRALKKGTHGKKERHSDQKNQEGAAVVDLAEAAARRAGNATRRRRS